jgi:small conductance mechanosensitive channel
MEMVDKYWNKTIQAAIAFWPHLISAVITLVIGVIIIKIFRKIMVRIINQNRFDTTLLKFVMDVLVWTFRIFLFVSVIAKLGVETSVFVAAVGAAGLAIGLSLQGSLANFAGGLLIILFKPLRVGDYIEAQGEAGTVSAIFIFSTKIITGNNQSIYMPNGALSNGIIRNFTKEPIRRAELTISVHHRNDLHTVRELLWSIIKADNRILTKPEPNVVVKDLTPDALNFAVFFWASNADFGTAVSDFYESLYYSFAKNNIIMPRSRTEIVLDESAYSPENPQGNKPS